MALMSIIRTTCFKSASPAPVRTRCPAALLPPSSSPTFSVSLCESSISPSRLRNTPLRRVAAHAISNFSGPSVTHGGGRGEEDRNEGDKTGGGLQKVLAASVLAGSVLGVLHFQSVALENWLSQFPGFRERILADDLFLAKVAIEGSVHVFNKTVAEYEDRRENFVMELEIALLHVVASVIANFMLIYLTAPILSLGLPLGTAPGPIEKFLLGCPANAFQVAQAGTSYSGLQRIAAMGLTGAKLFIVGTTSSLVGKAMENALINLRKAINKSSAGEVEIVPILPTSIAHGLYMAVFSNLRYQALAGVVEQRILEPMLRGDPLILCAITFAIRAGNAHLGSLLNLGANVKDNAPSKNELVEPKSNVTRGTNDQDRAPLFRLFDLNMYLSLIEGKFQFKLKRIFFG